MFKCCGDKKYVNKMGSGCRKNNQNLAKTIFIPKLLGLTEIVSYPHSYSEQLIFNAGGKIVTKRALFSAAYVENT